ncbi:hypothetical protein D3C76_1083890 [compost metagenome]
MIEGAFYRIFDPLGIEATAVVRGVPGRAKAAQGKRLRGQLAQRRNILFGSDLSAWAGMLRHLDREIGFAFNQPEALLLECIQPVGAGGRNFSLHALPGG